MLPFQNLTEITMDRDFRNGSLALDFPTEPFVSPLALLLASARLWVRTFPFLAAITLAIFLPGKLLLHFACYLTDVPPDGILSYVLMQISDFFLGALATPVIVYGLVDYSRKRTAPPIGESFRWGRRQWLRTLGNKLKVEVTVTLYCALLFIPGIVVMMRLIFTDVIVAIEADREPDPMQRSRKLSHGHRWRIFFTLFPLAILDLVGMFLMMGRVEHSRLLFAIAESFLAVPEQLGTIAIFLIYLGLVQNSVKKLKP
jgi:hypothetical protein